MKTTTGQSVEEQVYARSWEAAQRRTTLLDHWSAHPWSANVMVSYFLLPDSLHLAEVLVPVLRDLRMAGLDVVAPEELHLTLQSVGFLSAIGTEGCREVNDAVSGITSRLSRPSVHLGGVNMTDQGVFIEVRQWPLLADLRRQVRTAVAKVIGPARLRDADDFMPHIALGYVNRHMDAADVVRRVEPFRHTTFGRWDVASVDMVRLTRRTGHYRFDVMRRHELLAHAAGLPHRTASANRDLLA